MIQQGQALPVATLSELTADGMVNHDVTELFANKKSYSLLYLAHSPLPVQKLIYQAMWY